MKQIPLTQNQFAIVDDHWYDYLMRWGWHARWDESTQSFYAGRKEGNKTIQMHRVVANTPNGMVCDHKNHDTLNNTEENLRNVSKSQSCINRKTFKNNTLGIKGVSKQTNYESYKAYLNFQGRRVFDKTFKTIDEAISARKEAEVKYFGEYANQNK